MRQNMQDHLVKYVSQNCQSTDGNYSVFYDAGQVPSLIWALIFFVYKVRVIIQISLGSYGDEVIIQMKIFLEL